MLYTGDAKHTEEELSLADVYWNGDNSTLDLKVKVLYGDDQHTLLSPYGKDLIIPNGSGISMISLLNPVFARSSKRTEGNRRRAGSSVQNHGRSYYRRKD